MERTLSAPMTPIVKFIVPPIWMAGFGYGTYELWKNPADVVFNGIKGAATPTDQWLFLGAFLFGALMLTKYCVPLKRVVLTPDGLRVSNFHSDIFVPFPAIEQVSQGRWIGNRVVTVRLRADTGFGDQITFLPSTASRLAFWREDEVVLELRERAGLTRPDTAPSSAA